MYKVQLVNENVTRQETGLTFDPKKGFTKRVLGFESEQNQ